jgi:hypothetical protein
MNTELPAHERPRQRDDAQMRGVCAQAVQHSVHPDRTFGASRGLERALRIGGEIA